ncbi:pyruvate dehydrogenase (acetyl-transferring) E1 component subunit alpha [Candidatus Poribacteria bacterium]|nr:pyruvate dehydrogenase (acetyl-transferring) E1 component subunit alpha [Candidatus Poribacteria bacterium]
MPTKTKPSPARKPAAESTANNDGKAKVPALKTPEPLVKLPDERIVEMFRQMLLIRRFEEKTAQMYQMTKIHGFCHLYIGQEAVAVGSVAALEDKDYIFTTYRDHGHALIRGISAREVMAELFGKATGCSKGKGGSMHLFNAQARMMGGNGIVGGHVPLATGVGWKALYNKTGEVVLCYLGEAAMNQGVFHESLNMASLWNLPVIYICENNRYGMGTAVHRASAENQLYMRTAGAYRIRGVQCDGMDVLEMYRVTKEAADRARDNGRPTFIEAITYRYRGHSMSDPATTYRTKDEVTQWRSKDPMDRLREQFPALLTDELVSKMEAAIKGVVADSVEFAENSPQPDEAELWTDVYVDCEGYPKAT